MSSAKFKTPKPVLFYKSFTHIKNSKSSRIEPCGTPMSIFSQVDTYPPKLTKYFFPSSMTPIFQALSISHHNILTWLTKSFYPHKALQRSNKKAQTALSL